MKTKLLAVSTLLFVTGFAIGQEVPKRKLPLEISFAAGFEHANFSNLNARLKMQGLDKQSAFLMSGGVGIAYRTKPLIIGVQHNISGDFSDNDFSQNYLRFYLSTNTISFGSIITAPELGIGYQDTRVHVVQSDMSGTFDDFLQTRANRIRVDQRGAVADVGITFKRFVKERSLYLPFFRVGYKHGLHPGKWQVANAEATGAPADRVRGFYAQLTAGFGR
ncbi:hypothetical protein [Sphingobacterium griseoflavum]|uniref:Outer membrane protein beta-barrel domain-containing protein n=1 Tax=Sphingobacterium griseoflavum TaxID=1474952 RepID=A0ABQ3HV37_9SPHI|nr:hypothetical protein [Sphingobacterium griseoflavum]GHE37556.1 hypothetical protein GCM10017764_21030 [Sphingobacterium griseoflavum]